MRTSGVAMKVLGGVVAFCALAFGPIQQASAGCGDYLNIGHDPSASSQHGDAPMSPATTPCNGPNCHRHDGPPLTPSPELRPTSPTVKAAAILSRLAPSTTTVFERRCDDVPRPLPGYADPILRPPQGVWPLPPA